MPFARKQSVDLILIVNARGDERLTMRRKSINCVWTDDIIRPGIASFLHVPEVVLLVIIEIESLVIVAREPFFKRDSNRS